MITTFRPTYFAYAIEANMLLANVLEGRVPPQTWENFVVGASYIYLQLKQEFPTLPIFASFQIDEFNEDRVRQADGLKWLMPFTDYMAVSTYAYGYNYRPFNIPADYFTAIRALAPAKKFAIAETAWPAEPVFYPDPAIPGVIPFYNFHSSEWEQYLYMNRLLEEANANAAEFVNWFVCRDYDLRWEHQDKFLPSAILTRMWRDDGILNGAGQARLSGWAWFFTLVKPKG